MLQFCLKMASKVTFCITNVTFTIIKLGSANMIYLKMATKTKITGAGTPKMMAEVYLDRRPRLLGYATASNFA